MTVQELIDTLRAAPPDAAVYVWNAYDDAADFDVHVSVGADGDVHVGANVFGTEFHPKQQAGEK